MTPDRVGAQLGGVVLYAVARALRVRVTEWRRSPEAGYGSPTSYHLVGGAVDFGRETPDWKVQVMRFFSAGRSEDGWHEKGTAPHWHFSASWRTFAMGVGLVVATIGVISNG